MSFIYIKTEPLFFLDIRIFTNERASVLISDHRLLREKLRTELEIEMYDKLTYHTRAILTLHWVVQYDGYLVGDDKPDT